MKKRSIRMIFLLQIVLTTIISQETFSNPTSDECAIPSGCTVITISKGDSVFFGGNDDYNNPDSYYWVEPGDSSKFGVVWIGTPDNPQQGVNEKGLAYDANGLPRVGINPHSERIPVTGEYHKFCMGIMHECSTVKEVIQWAGNHEHLPYMHDQLHFADASGDAVIISAGKDGEMVFTRKSPGDGFLVSTNFNVANPSNGYSYPCWRYDKAREMLGKSVEKQGFITLKDATNVMDAVHVEKGPSWTIETMVADLVKGIIYIYFYYQYDKPVVIDLKSELANPHQPGPLSKLFPVDVQKEAANRFNKARANFKINRSVGLLWPAVVLLSLFLFFSLGAGKKRGLWFWVPAVVVLGPVALIVSLLAYRKHRTDFWQNGLIETLGNLMPLVISYTLALGFLILKMLSGNVPLQLQAGMMLGLPIISGLLFHWLFLAQRIKRRSGLFLIHRFPQVLVTTFLGLGGIIPVEMPLVNKTLDMTLLIPLSPFAVITWWAFTGLGAILGGLFIFTFEKWSVKRGFQAWNVLAGGEGEPVTPGWEKLWWWLLISILILLAGLITGIRLLK